MVKLLDAVLARIAPEQLVHNIFTGWVAQPGTIRRKFNQSQFTALWQQFPQARYHGPMYRILRVDDTVFPDPDQYYNWRPPTAEDRKRYDKREPGNEYLPLKAVGTLKSNGNRAFTEVLKRYVFSKDKQQYVSWCPTKEDLHKIEKIFNEADNDSNKPVQFEGSSDHIAPLHLRQIGNGLHLGVLGHWLLEKKTITDRDNKRAIEEAITINEVVGVLNQQFDLLTYVDDGYRFDFNKLTRNFLPKETYDIDYPEGYWDETL